MRLLELGLGFFPRRDIDDHPGYGRALVVFDQGLAMQQPECVTVFMDAAHLIFSGGLLIFQ